MKILFVWPNLDQFGYKPLGISILSSIAKKLGHQCELFQTSEIDFGFADNTQVGEEYKIFKPVDFSPYNVNKKRIDLEEHFTEIYNKFKPDCLAFSILSYERIVAGELVEFARKLNKDVPIIWGGKFPTLNPEKTLKTYDIDYLCIGEGLEAFPELLTAIDEGRESNNLYNIWVRNNDKIIKNVVRPLKENLDNLPYFDWDIFDKRNFYKPFDGKIYVGGDHMLNWGCPNKCSYCINDSYHKLYKDTGFKIRRYSVKRIIKELQYLINKFKIEFFTFHDENFLVRPTENLRELSKEYKEKVNVPFVIMTNANSVNKKKVEFLKEMNCASVSIGIETGNTELRKNILNRIESKKNIVNAFKIFKEIGIRTSSFNMMALPYETRKTYMDTVRLNREAQVQYPNNVFLFPFEGTKIREIAIKGGFFDPEGSDKEALYSQIKPALHFDNLTEGELIEMRKVFVFYVKLPEIYELFIKRSEKLDDIGKKLRRILNQIYEETVWKNDGWFKDDGNQQLYLTELNKILSK